MFPGIFFRFFQLNFTVVLVLSRNNAIFDEKIFAFASLRNLILSDIWSPGLFNTNNDLFKAVSWGSAILQGNSVYSFGGRAPSDEENYRFPVQRIDLAQDGTIEQVELIAEQSTFNENPFLLITDADTCVPI